MKYLSKIELGAMLEQAKAAGPMDHLMILLAFNHGLRVSEVLDLTTENFVDGHLIVQRLKGSCKTALMPDETPINERRSINSHTVTGDRVGPNKYWRNRL